MPFPCLGKVKAGDTSTGGLNYIPISGNKMDMVCHNFTLYTVVIGMNSNVDGNCRGEGKNL